jgi:hypothetical protein
MLMGLEGTLRAMESAQRRQQRDAQKRQRELERQNKEQAKLSAIEQARLEVETYENRLEVLLSVHKEQGEIWDWTGIAASLPALCPKRNSYYELQARQQGCVLPPDREQFLEAMIKRGEMRDEQAFENALQTYSSEKAEGEKLKNLAFRILAGEHKAYIEALVEFSPLREISDLGSSLHFTVHSTTLIECEMKVNSTQTIPTEAKSLTSSGKMSVKLMSRGRFHEIYQDYVCGCMLRVAREAFAMLPVETLLVTALADLLDSRTGHTVEKPVMSAAMSREIIAKLHFENIDPSDAMANFQHRGDFKASRKSEVFQPIIPLTPADIARSSIEDMGFCDLIANVQKMREELKLKITELSPSSNASDIQTASAP